jgi:hypothetical protein
MTLYFDGSVSGSGVADLVSGQDVQFVSVDVTTVGPLSSIIEADNPDHVLRVGWVSLGDHFDVGFGDVDHWREIIWVNFEQVLWTPQPSGIVGGAPLSVLARRVRWWFNSGTVAWLRVFGP